MAEETKRKRQSKSDVSLDILGLEIGKIPPQALDVEEAVLGALLVEPNCVDDAIAELSPRCFYSEKNRLVYEAMTHLFNNHSPLDVLTVSQQLRKNGNLEVIGGQAYLATLSSKIGAAANVEYHVRILKQKCIQRDLITAAYTIEKDAFDDKVKVDDLVDKAQSLVFSAIADSVKNDVQDVGSIISQVMTDIDNLQKNPGMSGVPSGFPTLDRVTLGWQSSDLIIIAARPSVGKTALVLNMARNAAVDYEIPVAIFSLEMSAKQLVKRMMLSETGLPSEKLKGGVPLSSDEWKTLETHIRKLTDAPIYIDETPSLPVMEFRSKAKRLVKQKGVKLLIVDYLQLMQPPAEARGALREQEVAAISRALKATAKELNVPVLALSQLRRSTDNRDGSNNRPVLSDLRESGSIEQDADMVLFLRRYDYQGLSENIDDVGKTDLIIAKNRNGEVCDIHLRFYSSEARFVEEGDTISGYASGGGGDFGPAPNSGYANQYGNAPERGYVPISQMEGSQFSGNSEFDF